ncbi:MAG: hypothetical protein WCS77_01485 [Elusimicrobiaceae bacterium]|jgi:triacylglycerol esterase/lipase EstA (alpha/beta hydrolase family)
MKTIPVVSEIVLAAMLICMPAIAQDTPAQISDAELAAKVKPYTLLFVPGFLSDFQAAYFADQINWAKSNGIDTLRVAIQSENSTAQNSRTVASAVRKSSKPVIMITHSKGGLDTLDMLIKYPDLRPKIKGWIAMQAPFFGSPVADRVYANPALNPMTHIMLEILGGNMGSLNSLRVAVRTRYMSKNAASISSATADISVLCVVYWVKKTSAFSMLSSKDYKSDGVVPVESQKLPDKPFIEIEGADHLTAIRSTPGTDYNRETAFKNFLNTLFK